MGLEEDLRRELEGFSRLAVIGIGSEIRGDDGAGIYIMNELQRKMNSAGVEFLIGGTTPENLSGPLRRMKPSHILMIDTTKMGMKPGEGALVDPAKIGERGFSTHTFSLAKIADYFKEITGAEVVFLGIEPKSNDLGEGLSAEVTQGADELVRKIISVLSVL